MVVECDIVDHVYVGLMSIDWNMSGMVEERLLVHSFHMFGKTKIC